MADDFDSMTEFFQSEIKDLMGIQFKVFHRLILLEEQIEQCRWEEFVKTCTIQVDGKCPIRDDKVCSPDFCKSEKWLAMRRKK